MSKTDVEAKRELAAMVARVWERQLKMGIAIPTEPLTATLRRKLRKALEAKPKRRR